MKPEIDLPPLPNHPRKHHDCEWEFDEKLAIQDYARAAVEADRKRRGEVIVTKTQEGEIVAVTRQDADGRILSVIAEADRQRRGEPAGWRIVPIDPTIEMLDAGDEAMRDFPPSISRYETQLPPKVAYYRAMINAAPQPAEPCVAPTLHNANSGAQNGIQAPQHAEPRLDAPAQVGPGRFGIGVKWSTVIRAAQRHHEYMRHPEQEQARLKKFGEAIKAIQPAEPVKLPSDDERAAQGLPPYNPRLPTDEEMKRLTENGRKSWGKDDTEPVRVPSDAQRWHRARTLPRSWWRDAFNRIQNEGVTLDELIDAEIRRKLP